MRSQQHAFDTFRTEYDKAALIANALSGYHIGLDEEADGVWSIFSRNILLAKCDEWDCIVRQ